MATFCCRVNSAGGQAEAYLPKQPGLHHTSCRKNCHDSTTTRRENERVATGRERRENREVETWEILGGDQQHRSRRIIKAPAFLKFYEGAGCGESRRLEDEDKV